MLRTCCLPQEEISKLINDYLGLLHFPPLLKVILLSSFKCRTTESSSQYIQSESHSGFSTWFAPNPFRVFLTSGAHVFYLQDELEEKVEGRRTVYLELVFGYHFKAGTGNTVSW